MGFSKFGVLALATFAAAELQPIVMKGRKFFYENGTQFYMKGIAYQQDTSAMGQTNDDHEDYIDPLADEKLCKRDVPFLEELGVNTIRTYAIDPSKDHKACMDLLDAAGIYVVSDLSHPGLSIERNNPMWNTEMYKRYTDVVDELARYTNVIGFFAGNEVSDAGNNTEASAYVKAALRDTKRHIAGSADRWLGVGYATNDHPDIRDQIAQYFNCGEEDEATDFWGYNIYSWCGDSSMEESGYDQQVEFYQEYPVPVFFAEYGCNEPGGAEGRIFTETEALYSDEMTEVFSGGLVYMYFQEDNDYGVVEIKNGKVETFDSFDNLAEQHKKADPKRVNMDEYEPTGQRDTCPEVNAEWMSGRALPPTPDAELCDCMVAAAECSPLSSLKEKDFGELFGFVCGEMPDLCMGINGNASTGIYGAYSMCTNRAKLTFLLDAYYKEAGSYDACDHDGAAELTDASADASCDGPLAEAHALNQEVVTATAPMSNSAPTGTTDEPDFGMTSAPIARTFSLGGYAVGLYMLVSVGVGGAIVLL